MIVGPRAGPSGPSERGRRALLQEKVDGPATRTDPPPPSPSSQEAEEVETRARASLDVIKSNP